MKHLTDTQAAWLAGFIDGDGCITVAKHRSAVANPYVMASQKHPGVLYRIRDLVGVGRVRKGIRAYTWDCWGEAAIQVVKRIHPYLFAKKRQASLLMQMERGYRAGKRLSVEERNIRADVLYGMRDLNSGKGWGNEVQIGEPR